MADVKLHEWLSSFDEKAKQDLIEENKMEAMLGTGKGSRGNKDYINHLSKLEKKRIKQEDIKKKYTCKKAVYEGAKMLDPAGLLLCHTENKKARWYVLKGLAKLVHDDGNDLTIQLNFEPNR